MPVGRRKTKHKNLPPRMHLKRGRYYYGRNQEFLGDNLADAVRAWAEREAAKAGDRPETFRDLADQYRARELPAKSVRTQRDYNRDLDNLLSVFGSGPLHKFVPKMIRDYLDKRINKRTGEIAKTRADREIALFSAIWNWGRDKGKTNLPNPCTGVKRYNPEGRDRYVTDEEFTAVWEAGDDAVKLALELHLLTGQRPADVLKMTLADVRDGALWVRQGKTKHPLRLQEMADLGALLTWIRGQRFPEDCVVCLHLIRNEKGQPLTYDALFNRFEKARAKAGIHFQLRDLRAKAGTDLEDLALAQKLLGHTTRAMTEHYIKRRAGEKVTPLLRTPRRIADKK